MNAVLTNTRKIARVLGQAPGRQGTRTLAAIAAGVMLCAGCGHVAASKPSQPQPEIVKTKNGIEMVQIPAGTFTTGSEPGAADATTRRTVAVDSILVDRYEVTQEEYEKLVIGNPSKFKDRKNPVERVRWVEAALYCNGRSAAEGFQPCYDENTFACNYAANGYRLPTEAEWEYASRAGADGEYSFGSDASRLGDYAWFRDNSSERTHPVGTKKPNPWGLYDMYGNVGEWCQDVFDEKYDPTRPPVTSGSSKPTAKRVLRGGSWSSGAPKCRSSSRSGESPGSFADACFARADIGFRCVRRAPAPSRAAEVADGRSAKPERSAQAADNLAHP
jgi:formylglycine-generating enzyme required for sulfatase activity